MENVFLFVCISATILIYICWCIYLWKNFKSKWNIIERRKLVLFLTVFMSVVVMCINEFHPEKEMIITTSHLGLSRQLVVASGFVFILATGIIFWRDPDKKNKKTLFITNKLFDIAFLLQPLGFSLARTDKEMITLAFTFLFAFLIWIVISTPREFF